MPVLSTLCVCENVDYTDMTIFLINFRSRAACGLPREERDRAKISGLFREHEGQASKLVHTKIENMQVSSESALFIRSDET